MTQITRRSGEPHRSGARRPSTPALILLAEGDCRPLGAFVASLQSCGSIQESTSEDLLDRFSYDCLWRAEARGKRGASACGVYLPDLEQPRPPDLPPGLARLRVVVRND